MRDSKQHFVFLIEHGFTMQAFSSAIEVLRLARKFSKENPFSYSVASLDDENVKASNGIEVVPTCDLGSIPKPSIIVVVSGAGVYRETNDKMSNFLRRCRLSAHTIWGISSGVVRLAQAGLLDNQVVAAHWEDIPYLKDAHPRVHVSSSLFVASGKHPTCSGGAAAADLMMNYVRQTVSRDLVDEIVSRLLLDGFRDGRIKQSVPAKFRYSTTNEVVFNAIRLMEANMFEPLTLSEVSRRIGVSKRQLERNFKSNFQKTPKSVYTDLRLAAARQEVLLRRRKLLDIAIDYGFAPANFTQVYRRAYGVLPSKDRAEL